MIRLERLGLTARPVKGEHELRPQSLSQWVLAHERLELPDECGMAPVSEIPVDPPLETGQTQLLQPRNLRLGEGLVRELGKRGAPPDAERLLELPLGCKCLDPFEVELAGLDAELVAGRARDDSISTDCLPKLGDVHLQRLLSRRRRAFAPERLDQTVVRDHAVRVEQEHRKQSPLLCSADVDDPAVLEHLERAQDSKLHVADDANTVSPETKVGFASALPPVTSILRRPRRLSAYRDRTKRSQVEQEER